MEAIGGGTARHLIDLVRHVPRVRHEAVTPQRRLDSLSDDAAVDALRAAGAVVHVVPMRRQPAHPANFKAIARVRRLIRTRRVDIVHGHSAVGGAIARLAAAGTGSVRVYTPNALPTGAPALAVERLLRPLTDHLVAVSPSEADLAVRLHLIARGDVTVVANGIDLDPPPAGPDLRSVLGLAASTPLVGTISRLVPQKAPEQFVRMCFEVAAVRPHVHFVLIGDGPLRQVVEALLRDSPARSRIHHLPDLVNPARVIGQLNVFCLTSRFEGGPYTPLEAMRAGVPVVLTDAVGSRDAVEDGRSGLLAPVDDPPAIARQVLALLDDRELAERLAAAGHERFRSRFDVRLMGAATGDLYRRLVAPSRSARPAAS
jgi:glycosyltransferase involved in cell wall biosynthesis